MERRPGGGQAAHEDLRFARGAWRARIPATILALLAAAGAQARGPAPATSLPAGVSVVSEDELRSVSARGFPDRLLDSRSLYLANGNAVEALGDTARLLNPPLLLDGDTRFSNILFNPANLSTVVDANGTGLIRLSTYIDEARIDNVRAKGSAAGFGDVVIRRIDLRGTVIRVSRAR